MLRDVTVYLMASNWLWIVNRDDAAGHMPMTSCPRCNPLIAFDVSTQCKLSRLIQYRPADVRYAGT